MTEVLQELVSDAKRHKFSTIPKLSDDGKWSLSYREVWAWDRAWSRREARLACILCGDRDLKTPRRAKKVCGVVYVAVLALLEWFDNGFGNGFIGLKIEICLK